MELPARHPAGFEFRFIFGCLILVANKAKEPSVPCYLIGGFLVVEEEQIDSYLSLNYFRERKKYGLAH